MNATCWTTLTEFVKYLGREGKCVVDETEQGWFIQYIDRDPKLMEKQRQMEQNQKMDMDEETRQRLVLEAQIAAAMKRKLELGPEMGSGGGGVIDTDRERDIKINLAPSNSSAIVAARGGAAQLLSLKKKPRIASVFGQDDDEEEEQKDEEKDGGYVTSSTDKLGVIDSSVMSSIASPLFDMEAADKADRKENWLHGGIVVKIINKKIGEGKYYKQKGVVKAVLSSDEFVGDVLLPCGSVLRLDQEDLETVIPKVGGAVLVVNGVGRY
jgi:DNA/RNA-binding protein KIN17